MDTCGICGQREGAQKAGVYVNGEKRRVPVCTRCVREAMSKNRYSLGFAMGLQLCWFITWRQGLFSVTGLLAAAFAAYGLVRIIMLLAARLALRAAPERPVPDWIWKYAMARAVTEDLLCETYAQRCEEDDIQTPRAYERNHSAQ